MNEQKHNVLYFSNLTNFKVILTKLLMHIKHVLVSSNNLLGVLFLDCEAIIPGCEKCSLITKDDILGGKFLAYQCTLCKDGLYLYSNTTISKDVSMSFTTCVRDCTAVSPFLINNPYSMSCENLG